MITQYCLVYNCANAQCIAKTRRHRYHETQKMVGKI
uniref:Uncharacterized protein n=1 Tax=Arundo donax TaxID=35708 RepID=A0A0A9H7V2_ARUDO